MHILFFTQYFPPEVHAPASRTYDHCKQWIATGHKVTVVTCAPSHPKGVLFTGYKNRFWQSEDINGIKVIRVWSLITPNKGFFKRIFGYMTFFPGSILAGIFVRNVDMVIGTSPQIFSPLAAGIVSFFKRTPWVFEIRDILSESLLATSLVKNQLLLKLVQFFEVFLYRRATAIVVVTNSFKEILINQGIQQKKIHVITNGVDLEKFKPIAKDDNLIESLGIKNSFIAGYIGTHGLSHGLDSILYAAELLQKKYNICNIKIVLLGDGANKESLLKLSNKLGLKNVLFLDLVPRNKIHLYWSILDVSIIHLKKTNLFDAFIPSKIFEAMGMGIPLLHCVSGESADIVKSNNLGCIVESENFDQIAKSLIDLSKNNHKIETYRAANIEASLKFSRVNLANKMMDVLEKL
jgi:glycosyltransferase involved in cell wall biosynthesis